MTTLENEKNVNGVEESKRAEMHKTYGMWYKEEQQLPTLFLGAMQE